MDEGLPPKHVVLRYWPCRGRAQPLADFLVDRGIAFDDTRSRWDGSDWATMREDPDLAGPFASLPVLQWGELRLAEVLPIAAFLARTLCQPSRDPASSVRHDMFCSAAYLDVLRPLADLIWCRHDFPGDSFWQRAQIVLPKVLGKLRRIGAALDQRSPFIGGDAPTVADFFVFEALEELAYVMKAHAGLLADALPDLMAHRDRLRARPAIEQLFDSGRHTRYTFCPAEPDALAELDSFPWASLCTS